MSFPYEDNDDAIAEVELTLHHKCESDGTEEVTSDNFELDPNYPDVR